MGVFLKDILARAALARREADRLAVIFRKIAGLFLKADRGTRGRGRDGPAGRGNS